MKKFNIADEKISVDKQTLVQAINTDGEFAITYQGAIVRPPYQENDIFIFKGSIEASAPAGVMMPKPKSLSELFGELYRVSEEENRVLFDAASAWSNIVALNQDSATYDDTTSDGIMDLGDKELEEMSWHAVEFGFTNREISDLIEAHCEGLLLCYHTEEPFMFSSLIYVDDIACAREAVYKSIKAAIVDKIENDPDFAKDTLTDDEEDAAKFFGAL